MKSNTVLKSLYEQDQHERESTNWESVEEVQLLSEADIKRQAHAMYLLENSLLSTHQDYYHAAMLFHHSDTVRDLALAVTLSMISMNMGNNDGKWLYARALDRFLLKIGQPQKFGTQFDLSEGKWVLCIHNKDTTDEERKQYDVPTLDHQLNIRANELNAK